MTLLARPGGSPTPASPLAAPEPERKAMAEQVALVLFITIPFLALLAAVPVAWGWGLGWHDVVIAARLLRRGRARHHRRLPPVLHPRLVQGQALAAGHAGGRRLDGHRGTGDPLGRRPPQAPRLLRPRGRPALARGATARRSRRWPRACGGRTPAGCSTSSRRRAGQVRPRPDGGPGPAAGRAGLPGRSSPSRCCCRPSIGGLWSMSWQGALTAFFWASPGPGRPAAPRHLVDQLDLPRHRRAPVPQPRPVGQRLVAGDPVHGRVLAQPAPRRPDLRPARRRPRASSTPAPA